MKRKVPRVIYSWHRKAFEVKASRDTTSYGKFDSDQRNSQERGSQKGFVFSLTPLVFA